MKVGVSWLSQTSTSGCNGPPEYNTRMCMYCIRLDGNVIWINGISRSSFQSNVLFPLSRGHECVMNITGSQSLEQCFPGNFDKRSRNHL